MIMSRVSIESLPPYLQISIKEWLENKDNPWCWDIYSDDLYGSINSAQHDGVITQEEADELRREYLGLVTKEIILNRGPQVPSEDI